MCNYCNQKAEKRYSTSLAAGEYTELLMYKFKNEEENHWVLSAEGEGTATIKINYCPFCGRKLNE